MSVSNSNVGSTTFKFVASDGGAPQKRRQVAQGKGQWFSSVFPEIQD
jgi:hypothetical protein